MLNDSVAARATAAVAVSCCQLCALQSTAHQRTSEARSTININGDGEQRRGTAVLLCEGQATPAADGPVQKSAAVALLCLTAKSKHTLLDMFCVL